jgi:hypothetical protein
MKLNPLQTPDMTEALSALSVRDFFAAAAAIACNNAHQTPARIARSAYELADAMILERERRRES